jgi:hypothetical protein
MISEPLKSRLDKQRAMTSITLRIAADVVESLKTVAELKGFSGYQSLLKSYVSAGLRRDEAELAQAPTARLLAALKAHGVPDELLQAAARDAA